MTRIYGLIAVILVLLIAIGLIIGGITSSILARIADSTDETDIYIKANDTSLTDLIHHHAVSLLDGAADGELSLSLDSYDINELLYALSKKGEGMGLRSLYVKETDGKYILYAPMTVIGRDTLLSGELSIYKEGDTFFIRVGKLSLGRLSIDSGIVSFLGVKGKITRWLDGLGISAYFIKDALTLQLSEGDIGNLIATAVRDNDNGGLINALYSFLMISENALELDIVSPLDIRLSVDMIRLNGRADSGLDGVNSYSESLLNDGIIDRGGIGLMAKYYLNGYGRLSEEEKQTVSERLKPVSAPDKISSYGGIIEREEVSLLSILLTQLELNTDYLLPGFKIGDGDISAMMSDLPLVGMVWQYASYRDNSCAYITVQSMYCVIGDDLIEIYIDVNLNGYILTLRADFITGESGVTAILGTLDSAYFGGVRLSDYETDSLFEFLTVKLQYDWISVDGEAQTLTLDFTSTFKENTLLVALLSGSKNIVTVCKSRLISDGGYMQITFSLF